MGVLDGSLVRDLWKGGLSVERGKGVASILVLDVDLGSLW